MSKPRNTNNRQRKPSPKKQVPIVCSKEYPCLSCGATSHPCYWTENSVLCAIGSQCPPGYKDTGINESGQTVYAKGAEGAEGSDRKTGSEPQTETEVEGRKAVTFEDTIAALDRILSIDRTSEQKWALSELSKHTGRSVSLLIEIYEDWQNETQGFNPVDVHDFIAKVQAEREWLIAANVSCGTTIGLVADGGVGKSLLAYDLCKAIATGQTWNGFRSKKSKVLIVQTDEPEIDTRERLDIAGFAEAVERGMVAIETNWQFNQIRKLTQWIDEHFQDGESGFVMIDSFTSANRSARSEEKDASYASVLYDLRDIANRKGITFMILHHTNKGGGSRGTTAFRNNVSEVWMLKKPDPKESQLSPLHRILEIEKSRSGCSGIYQIKLNPDDYSWTHEGDLGQNESGHLPLSARLLNYLELNRGVRLEAEELTAIASMGGASRESIRKQLERMRKKGLIEAEDRIRQREAGATRYKVYFAPKLSQGDKAQNQNPAILEKLSSEAQNQSGQDDRSLDNPNVSSDSVQRGKPAPSKDSRLAGQPCENTPDFQNNTNQLSQGEGDRPHYPDDFYGF